MKQKSVEEIANKLSAEIPKIGATIYVGRLGSCQYTSIVETYDLIYPLLKSSRENLEKAMGITYDREIPINEMETTLYACLEDSFEDDLEYYEDSDKHQEFLTEIYNPIDHVNKKATYAQYIKYTKECSWDLWSAYVGPLQNFQFNGPSTNTKTLGPILNEVAYDDNFRIGIELAYLTLLHGIALEDWADYDT